MIVASWPREPYGTSRPFSRSRFGSDGSSSTNQMGRVDRPSPMSVTALTVPTNARPSARASSKQLGVVVDEMADVCLVGGGVDQVPRRGRGAVEVGLGVRHEGRTVTRVVVPAARCAGAGTRTRCALRRPDRRRPH